MGGAGLGLPRHGGGCGGGGGEEIGRMMVRSPEVIHTGGKLRIGYNLTILCAKSIAAMVYQFIKRQLSVYNHIIKNILIQIYPISILRENTFHHCF